MKRLAERFPDKTYVGVDLAPQLVEIAQREAAGNCARFECADMFDVGGDFDFVVMRLLLQHLPSIDEALLKVAQITRSGGSALVIDSLDPARCFSPDLPEFMQFFGSYAQEQASQGRDRRAADRHGAIA
ncbi:MAG: class I SAM-dependent methyltransferase [Comamonadaceae bacterium]|nr:class I SAM-dependent methyltransferase [Comamonadaceae bacterium]